MTDTILVIDDQANVRALLKDYLTNQGYRVVTANDGQMGLFVARHEHPNLILLDIMMPNMDGFQFLPALRRESQVPVIIITARDEETDAVLGLELGADDYVIKPFRLRELIARVRSQLRRQGTPVEPGEFLRIGDLVLDRASHLVKVADKEVDLTPIEFDLLSVLMRSPGRVYTRSDLVNELTESGFAGLESTLNVHMRNLRLKIEPDPSRPIYLETVFGVGYRMNKQGAT
ncbi:MAG TPA: response regulator transcription factor [Anaerolineaceae bacterium]|nr:response regulator transcription factor [Anaerolineaceae bacterium]